MTRAEVLTTTDAKINPTRLGRSFPVNYQKEYLDYFNNAVAPLIGTYLRAIWGRIPPRDTPKARRRRDEFLSAVSRLSSSK